MAGVISVIIILVLSIMITRIASIALSHTGLSREASKFQARSAFTGVGFTTSESEKVVNHPVRRRILLLLMILGNAGIITAVSSLIIGFTGIENQVNMWMKLLILLGGIAILWYLANSRWIDRQLSFLINKILKRSQNIDVTDYASLLHLSGEYRISELGIECNHWLCDKQLKKTQLNDEGLNVLALSRTDGTFLGAPDGETTIKDGDVLIMYGRARAIQRLEKRLKGSEGNKEHRDSVEEQKKVVEQEKKEDEKSQEENTE